MTSRSRPDGRLALPASVKGVCFDDAGRVMLCLNWRDEWELPGGRPEAGEAHEACLEREILEETGMTITVCEALTEYAFHVVPDAWVHIITYGCLVNSKQSIKPSWEHRSVAFISCSALTSLTLPEGYQQAIAAWRAR